MRIIAGRLKGRRLRSPTWKGLRPTSDRLRETLFDVLGDLVTGARVLDGFAGTGAVGIEAVSRGASEVVFIDRDPRAAALIAENLRHCGVSEGCAIIRADLGRMSRAADLRQFNLIVLDPPYTDTDLELPLIRASGWLAPGGRLVLEHARRRASPPRAGRLTRCRVVRAGDSALSFYEQGSEPPPVAEACGRPEEHDA